MSVTLKFGRLVATPAALEAPCEVVNTQILEEKYDP